MEIPGYVIQKLNVEFGTSGQPHLILNYGEWMDTGCIYWPVSYEVDWLASDSTQEIDGILARARELLVNDPVIAYKGNLSWIDITITHADRIVVAPTTDQFDILRLEQTDGMNYELDTKAIIEKLMELDSKYGIDIVGASVGAVELLLKRIPEGEEAHGLGEWLFDFCPDIERVPTSFPGGRVALWWD